MWISWSLFFERYLPSIAALDDAVVVIIAEIVDGEVVVFEEIEVLSVTQKITDSCLLVIVSIKFNR